MNNRYLIPALSAGPQTVANLMRVIPEHLWDRAEPDRFSPREAVAHLADCESMLCGRFRDSVESPGTRVAFFDEDAEAIAKDYAGSDVAEQLEIWAAARAETLAYVAEVSDWGGHIIHPELGWMGSESVAGTIVGHDLYHISRLTELLADN